MPKPTIKIDNGPRTPSPLWSKALERYRDELRNGDDYEAILDIHSLQDLTNSLEELASSPLRQSATFSVTRLTPKFKFIDDFSAVLALCFGADAIHTAAVWGSIRLILSYAGSTGEIFQMILDMLEELSLTLPVFQVYENTLPLNHAFRNALLDVYSEVICFYARTIYFLRQNPHQLLRQNAWGSVEADFRRTQGRIKRLSATVQSEAEMARMRKGDVNYQEVLELIDTIKLSKADDENRLKYRHIPVPFNSKFSGRKDILNQIEEWIGPQSDQPLLKSAALFGLGGVGKTQLAAQFAHQNHNTYDVILWVTADNPISVNQSFRIIAEGLSLLESGDETKDAAVAVWKVKNWLNTTRSVWLVVFDNADDLLTLKTVWPTSPRGSILVTTRNLSVASGLPAHYTQVESMDLEDGSKLLTRLVGLEEPSPDERESALEICKMLGGFPLALSQAGGFITQRKLGLKDFPSLYQRHQAKIDARKTVGDGYDHTLDTVWNMSFDRLSLESTHLLNLVSFLDPDSISEEIFLQGSQGLDEKFSFLSDDMDLGDASESLLGAALINRVAEGSVLSVHRLIQSTVIRRLSQEDRVEYFRCIVHMLSWGFPDTWSKDVGHQISAWNRCERCLPHVRHLPDLAERYKLYSGYEQAYAELLLRCGWYLYEREMYMVAQRMVDQALSIFPDKTSLEYASAIDLDGLISLDLNNPSRSLGPFNIALEIRKTRLGHEDPFVSSSLNNLALAYTEMGELEKAMEMHQEAIRLRTLANSDRLENSWSNLSSLLLCMGKPDEAEEMMARCPTLQPFTDESFLATGNPRFSGNMVLLARIRLAQGRTTDALRLASKALAFRQKLLGNRMKSCDSHYDVANLLVKTDHINAAIEILEELVSISETFPEGEGQRARAWYKLSELYDQKGMRTESAEYKEKAIALRSSIRGDLGDKPFSEEEFNRLCLRMLW